jgi:hypothetical protein
MDYLIIGLVLLALIGHMGIVNAVDSFNDNKKIKKDKE